MRVYASTNIYVSINSTLFTLRYLDTKQEIFWGVVSGAKVRYGSAFSTTRLLSHL